MGPETALVTGINGVPYWYFYGLDRPVAGPARSKASIPAASCGRLLPPRQAIGCIVYPAAEVVEPGVIEHTYGDRFTWANRTAARARASRRCRRLLVQGRPEGAGAAAHPRRDLGEAVGQSGLQSAVGADARTLDRLAGEPDLRAVARGMMVEAQAVGEALGVRFAVDVDKRIDGAGEVGAHKTSMLQDLERGRPMEIDALLGAVVELAELTGQPMPLCRAVLALVRERARQAGSDPSLDACIDPPARRGRDRKPAGLRLGGGGRGPGGAIVRLRGHRRQHRRLRSRGAERQSALSGRRRCACWTVRWDRRATYVRVRLRPVAAPRAHARARVRCSRGARPARHAICQGGAARVPTDSARRRARVRGPARGAIRAPRQPVSDLSGTRRGPRGQPGGRVHVHRHLAAGHGCAASRHRTRSRPRRSTPSTRCRWCAKSSHSRRSTTTRSSPVSGRRLA